MVRRNDSIISVYKGYQIMCKRKGSAFFQNPQGACLTLTKDFMVAFLDLLDKDEKFRNNFYTNEINYLPITNSYARPDRTSIGFIEDYEIIKTSKIGYVFVKSPMGAYLDFPIDLIKYTVDLMNDEQYKSLFN